MVLGGARFGTGLLTDQACMYKYIMPRDGATTLFDSLAALGRKHQRFSDIESMWKIMFIGPVNALP